MPRDVLLFDLDGTLIDSAQGITVALNRVRAERGGAPLFVDAVRPMVALGAEALVARALGPLGEGGPRDVAAFRAHLHEVPADPAMIYPGVTDALMRLAAARWRLGIVTNKPLGLARTLLEKLALVQLFGVIVGGDSAPRPKPAPDPVLLALERLAATSSRALFVGDTGIDAAAAQACAIPFLLFTGGYGAAECRPDTVHARFGDFAGLVELVQQA